MSLTKYQTGTKKVYVMEAMVSRFSCTPRITNLDCLWLWSGLRESRSWSVLSPLYDTLIFLGGLIRTQIVPIYNLYMYRDLIFIREVRRTHEGRVE